MSVFDVSNNAAFGDPYYTAIQEQSRDTSHDRTLILKPNKAKNFEFSNPHTLVVETPPNHIGKMAETQAKLQALSEDYQKLQQGKSSCLRLAEEKTRGSRIMTELQAAVASRQKLQAQKTENIGVQKVPALAYCAYVMTRSLWSITYRSLRTSRMRRAFTSWSDQSYSSKTRSRPRVL